MEIVRGLRRRERGGRWDQWGDRERTQEKRNIWR
jgi:hypothetical protein